MLGKKALLAPNGGKANGAAVAAAAEEEEELETKLTAGAEPKDATPNEKGDAVEDAAELEIGVQKRR